MPLPASIGRLLVSAVCVATLLISGCGGADSRKARHLEKGERFFAEKNFEKARVEFRNALQIAPTDSQARYENGRVDEKLGNPREAAQFYQGAIDSNADNLNARTALGRLYVFAAAPDRALEVIDPAFSKHPDDAGLLTVRAAAHVQQKDLDAALADAERAERLAPDSEDTVAVLAGVYQARGDTDKARSLLEGAVARLPKTVDLRLALAQLYAAIGGPEQAAKVEAILIELVRLNPGDKAQRVRLAQFYSRSNRIDDAERVMREAVAALPADRELKVSLVDFLAARRSRDAAAKELETMIAASPKDYDLQLAQAQFYQQGEEYAKAEAVYRRIIAAANVSAPGITARDRLAALKVQTNDEASAGQLLSQVLAASPRDNDALILRGNLSLEHRDPKSAIADFRSVLRDQPNAVGVMRSLARAHLANGEPALAEETMRRAVDASPKDAGARLDLAQLLNELGKPAQAKPVIDELVKQQPTNTAALEMEFKIAAAIGDMGAAQAAADAMVAAYPKEPLGYFEQGEVAEKGQRLDVAVRLYSSALEVRPEAAEPLQALAGALVKLKKVPEALKRLDAVAAQFPALPIAPNVKGEVLLNAQRPAEAQAAFKMAIERQPKWWVPYRGLASAQAAAHDEDAAVETLRGAIGQVQQPQPLETELAGLFQRQGKLDQAIQVYEDALRQDPRADVAANNLAMLLITYKGDAKSVDRAKALAARFADSANPSFLDTYGWVLYKHGENAAAVAALKTAVSRTPDSPVSLYHLGMAEASVGQDDEARDNLARSLKFGRSFAGMDEAKTTLDKLATVGTGPAAPKT